MVLKGNGSGRGISGDLYLFQNKWRFICFSDLSGSLEMLSCFAEGTEIRDKNNGFG